MYPTERMNPPREKVLLTEFSCFPDWEDSNKLCENAGVIPAKRKTNNQHFLNSCLLFFYMSKDIGLFHANRPFRAV